MNRLQYHISELAALWGAQRKGNPGEGQITHVFTDSRSLLPTAQTLFFALKGPQHDGHSFISELAAKGVRYFVVNSDATLPDLPDACFLLVPDTLQALQQLAAYHRSRFTYPVIGITGSNGKTLVKEWIYQLLREDYNSVRSPKSYNSQVGVPLSLLLMEAQQNLGIFEAGISQPGEMEKLANMIRPDIAILTTIGPPHSENFTDTRQQAEEKLCLFEPASVLIYNRDNEEVEQLVKEKYAAKKLRHWSLQQPAFLQITESRTGSKYTTLTGICEGETVRLVIPFTDKASVENCITCWVLLRHLGFSAHETELRMAGLTPLEMRLELLSGTSGSLIVNDSYNSDTASLSIALDFLHQQKQQGKKTVILSDILQDKSPDAELYGKVIDLLQHKGISRLIGVGEKISRYATGFRGEKLFFPSTEALIEQLPALDFTGQLILVKGARLFGFERITARLQQQVHETVLEINLDAMAHNLRYYRARLDPGTRIMAMVKAFSYGSGSYEIASLLEFNRVDYLAVAYADEGVALRRAGITLPIVVMNPVKSSFVTMQRYRLEPEIYSVALLQDLLQLLDPAYYPPIHLKIDTGMHRLGFDPEEIPALCALLVRHPELKIGSVFSHLAASDNPQHDEFSRTQVKALEKAAAQVSAAVGYPVLRHILNSGGISRLPEAQLEMVRLGIGLYGVGITEEDRHNLQPVSQLLTLISQVKTVSASETVGYNRNGKLTRATRIATLPIGYADGFSRSLGNGRGYVRIKGKKAPVVGNVCMDMCMVDITDIPEAAEGDRVVIFGPGLPVEEVAAAMQTIPYEVLTSVSARVKRIYTRES